MPLATAPSEAPFVLVRNPGTPGTVGPIMIGHPSTQPAPLSPVPQAWLRAQAAREAMLAELPRPNRGMASRITDSAPDLLRLATASSTIGATFMMLGSIGANIGVPEDEPLTRTVTMLGPPFVVASAVITGMVGTAMWLTRNDPDSAPVPLHVFEIEPQPAVPASGAPVPGPAAASTSASAAFAAASTSADAAPATASAPASIPAETQPFGPDPHVIDRMPTPQRTRSEG
jgi:hypothetical protein